MAINYRRYMEDLTTIKRLEADELSRSEAEQLPDQASRIVTISDNISLTLRANEVFTPIDGAERGSPPSSSASLPEDVLGKDTALD